MDQTAYFEQMRNRRRNEILTVAREMFLKQGIAAFSMQQLAKNLDVSTVTLYKYFKNMDAIMQGLKVQIIGKLAELFFLKSIEKENVSMDTFLYQMRGFYDVILKNREDITLLILFDIHTRTEDNINTTEEETRIYVEKWSEKIRGLLITLKSQGIMKEELDVEEAVQFINQINTALVQRIGLLSDEEYQKSEGMIKGQIEQMLELFTVYLKKNRK